MHLFLPFCAVAFCVGVALGRHCQDHGALALVVACLACGLALAGARRLPALGAGALLLATATGGAALGAAAWTPRVPACHVSRHTGRQASQLQATVVAAAVVTPAGRRQLLAAHLLERGPRRAAVCGGVELSLPHGLVLRPGERVLLRTRLRPAVGARNPGGPSARLRYRSHDVGATARADRVVILEPRARGALERVRRRVRAGIRAAAPGPSERGLVGALVLGDRQTLPPPVRQRFARAGVSHLLAISGLHLSLLAGALLAALRWLLLWVPGLAARTDPRPIAAAGAAVAVVGYTVLTGASPSTVRACVMVCACAFGLLWSRAPDLARPLSLAAMVLLALDPLNLWRPGFQLSFCAVIGIALVHRRLSRRARAARPVTLSARIRRWLGVLALTTAAATLATGPVVAHHFGQVSLVGLAVNLVAIPWTTLLLLPAGLAGATLSLVWPPAGEVLLMLAAWAASILDRLCALAAAAPAAVVHLAPGWPATLGLLAAMMALLSRGRARLVSGVAAVALLVAAGASDLGRTPALELTFLDVGQGDSTLARLPDGTTLLVDGGGSLTGTYDPGAARVVPFLRGAGVRRLDLVVATHPHPDHVKGLNAVLEQLEVGELWTCWHGEENPWLEALLATARRRGVPVTRPRLLRRGRAVVRPLWPRGYGGHCADPGFEANDNSIVLRLEYGRAAALLPGDIEGESEALLARTAGRWLRADLLKAPHHGSGTSSTEPFLRAVSPRLAVISCGLDNAFGIPPPRVLARYQNLGVPLARVDLDGAVGVTLQADGSMTWRRLVAAE